MLLELLADGIDVGFHLRFEAVPLGFQLPPHALPGDIARLRLFFDGGLKLVMSLLKIDDQLIGLHFDVSLHLACLGFRRRCKLGRVHPTDCRVPGCEGDYPHGGSCWEQKFARRGAV